MLNSKGKLSKVLTPTTQSLPKNPSLIAFILTREPTLRYVWSSPVKAYARFGNADCLNEIVIISSEVISVKIIFLDSNFPSG